MGERESTKSANPAAKYVATAMLGIGVLVSGYILMTSWYNDTDTPKEENIDSNRPKDVVATIIHENTEEIDKLKSKLKRFFEFRRELLKWAETFYADLSKSEPFPFELAVKELLKSEILQSSNLDALLQKAESDLLQKYQHDPEVAQLLVEAAAVQKTLYNLAEPARSPQILTKSQALKALSFIVAKKRDLIKSYGEKIENSLVFETVSAMCLSHDLKRLYDCTMDDFESSYTASQAEYDQDPNFTRLIWDLDTMSSQYYF